MGKQRGRRVHPLFVQTLRWGRSLHATLALGLLILVVISSLTGILLGWKKNSARLQPPTRKGEVTELRAWLPLHELQRAATAALAEELGPGEEGRLVVDRMDVRPDKGIVKVLYPGSWEVQVDGGTAAVRSVARRHSDWIETIHDGSIVSDLFKLVTMNVLGVGLLALTGTGFWMWYGPKRLRRIRLAETRAELESEEHP